MKRWAFLLFLFLAAAMLVRGDDALPIPAAPDWTRNLVIYEISTKEFTSPNGPESGIFQSLKERVPYLADLGINGVWLTGWNLANDHFRGIWTQYATIDPSKLDPSLGTEHDFKDLIAEMHKYGIKVFLDSTEHGVVNESPLIAQHPDWFVKGTWGMTDYDWRNTKGPHPDLDKWWVDYWMRWITEFGADGARLDVAVGKPALWAEIKRRAAEAGHPIAIFGEAGWNPVCDFTEREMLIPGLRDGRNLVDMAQRFRPDLGESDPQTQSVVEFDGPGDNPPVTLSSRPGKDGSPPQLQIKFLGEQDDKIGPTFPEPDGKPDDAWQISPVPKTTKLLGIGIEAGAARWFQGYDIRQNYEQDHALLVVERQGDTDTLIAHGAPVGDWLSGGMIRSMLLSCHDHPAYSAGGSPFFFGYHLFAPAIFLFMSGEEFDATYKPVPRLTPDTYGQEPPSPRSHWLYGSWIQWDQLKEKEHADMLAAVTRLIHIRTKENDLVRAAGRGVVPNIADIGSTPVDGAVSSPNVVAIPYVLWNDHHALLVGGHRDPHRSFRFTWYVPVSRFGWTAAQYKLTDLWGGGGTRIVSAADLARLDLTIGPDRTAGGGLALYELEPISPGT